jgi:cobalt transporter subunit CbtB
MTQNAQKSATATVINARATVLAPAVLALLLGAFLVLGTGFAHSDTIHNAAHDTRHSFAFPCH